MFKYLLLASLIVIGGCATVPTENLPLSPEDKNISASFNTTDSTILGKYARKNKKDVSKFTEADYLKILNEGKSKREKYVQELFPLFTTREFIAHKNTYVFCAFSPRLQIAFCDDAYCESVEQFVRSSNAETLKTLKAAIATPGICRR